MIRLCSVIMFTIIHCFISAENTTAQDTSIIKYFPLEVGNRWVYSRSFSYPVPPGSGKNDVIVTSCFISMNHLYYVLRTTVYYLNGTIYSTGTENFRIDSLTGNICKLGLTNECLYDSLKLKKNDTANLSCGNYCGSYVKCTDTSIYSIFGQSPSSKTFYSSFFEGECYRKHAKNFGMVFSDFRGMMIYYSLSLTGCFINGMLYGDTNIVGITQISSEVPQEFKLYQNYPNPFNPATKIRFILPLPSKGGEHDVKLVVYDVLGSEVANLISPLRGGQEGLSPGTYEVEFDATNYPSGVYYYTLTSGDFTQTKKMVIIK